jgi:uncharacterized protein (DUF305 family)
MEYPIRILSLWGHVRLATLVLIGTILLSFAAGCGSAGQGSTPAGTPAAGPAPAVDSAAYMPASDAPYVPADADFVRGMLVHHAQALVMAALVDERTNTPAILSLARRITTSQEYEIGLMNNWLAAHDEPAPARGLGPDGGAPPEHAHMAGLASVEQMRALERAEDDSFDRMFLRLMIPHHEGALTMVDRLLTHEGAGQEPALFQLISAIDADQRAEIARMRALLERLQEQGD